jgi:putative hydrolase of the HAD superfamily
MIKAILFDIDNTLIDFYNFKNKCVDAALDAMIRAGLKIKKQDAWKIIKELYEEYGMEYKEIFQAFMKKAIGKIDYRILSHGLLAYRKARLNVLVPYPNVKQTIQKLKKKYKIAVLSDAPIEKAWMRIVLMDIDKLLDIVITFEDTKKRKPHPLPFRKAVEKLKVHPSEILMVGDSIHKDMQGAKRIGMHTCLALYGRTLIPKKNPENVDFMINHISDLLKIAKKIS